MKEYEISVNNKELGKVKLYKDNLNKDIKNSLITSSNNKQYRISDNYFQLYEAEYIVNNIDDLYDIVSKYTNNNEIFNIIEKIKEYNNIKTIKKDTKINIVIPEIYLNNLSLSKNNIDLNSLFDSKVYFINNVLKEISNIEINNKVNKIINNYNSFKNSNEYEFLTDKEKENILHNFINNIDIIIKDIENNTNYRYEKDFIIPIKIHRQ